MTGHVLKERRGAAMVMNICIVAVITALALSLLLVATVVLSTAGAADDKEKSRLLAVSLSKELEKQLVRIGFSDEAEEAAARDGTLWFYVKDHMQDGTWPYFNEDERGHTAKYAYRTLTLESNALDDKTVSNLQTEDTEILMYWESSVDAADFDRVPLTVSVTCKSGESTCTVVSEYTLDYSMITDNETGSVYARWTWALNWRE